MPLAEILINGGPTTNDIKTINGAPPPPHLDVNTIIEVRRSPKAFSSFARSLIDLPAGALFAHITTATPAKKAYTTVQTGPNTHIELNSDLVYCNHSCDPSLIFDMATMEVRVVEGRDLRVGDALTFFYPSSEWSMAQPFECGCGAGSGKCLGRISGANDINERVLRGYWLNRHIERMLEERAGGKGGQI